MPDADAVDWDGFYETYVEAIRISNAELAELIPEERRAAFLSEATPLTRQEFVERMTSSTIQRKRGLIAAVLEYFDGDSEEEIRRRAWSACLEQFGI